MIERKQNNRSMYICLIGSVLAVLKMYTNNNIFLIAFMGLIGIAMIYEKIENKVDYLIFFSTWPYVLKFDMSSYSLFLFLSLEYCFLALFHSFTKNQGFNKKVFTTLLIFIGYSLAVSYYNTFRLNRVLGVLVNYISVTLAILYLSDRQNIKKWIWLYSVSMLIQCFVAYIGHNYIHQIGDYLNRVSSDLTMITNSGIQYRFKGFDDDPNYFSAQILIAICCLFICAVNDKRKGKPMIAMIILAIFGLLTYSKMYLLTIVIFAVLAIFLTNSKNIATGFFITFGIFAVGIVIWQIMGDTLFAGFTSRLENVTDFSDLTTGRFDIWKSYINEIIENPMIFTFGVGFGNYFLNGYAAHNGYLSMWYFWGVVGICIFLYMVSGLSSYCRKLFGVDKSSSSALNNITLIIILTINFSLDGILMDFFPIAMMFCVLLKNYESEDFYEDYAKKIKD